MNAIQAIPRGWRAGCIAALCVAWGSARAGVVPPLYVGNNIPVLDQNGVPLEGTIDSDPAERARVEVRQTATGAIFAPSTNGAAHPANPLLTPDSVGGIGMNSTEPGKFAMVITNPPPADTKVFARAFNAPTLEEASFYADTAVVPASGTSLIVTFGPAQPLDSNDDDGDGLINSWEKAMGTYDRGTPDYDGDGQSDYQEMLAGTAADDPTSLLAFSYIWPQTQAAKTAGTGSRAVLLGFQCIPGKTYRIEQLSNLVGEQSYLPASGPLTAGEGQYLLEFPIEVPVDAVNAEFRIRLQLP